VTWAVKLYEAGGAAGVPVELRNTSVQALPQLPSALGVKPGGSPDVIVQV
jgi:hypothetical protein